MTEPFIPEGENAERAVIVDVYKDLESALSELAYDETITNFDESEISIGIDRSSDSNSPFEYDSIILSTYRSIGLIRHYILDRFGIKPEKGESWIRVIIGPKDPYRSPIFREGDDGMFLTEYLSVFISSTGRGFELTEWQQAGEPEQGKIGKPSWALLTQLKEGFETGCLVPPIPNPEPIGYRGPVHGQNIERIRHISQQIKMGNYMAGN